ncbi:hypothetical protein ES704_03029 [subsurface metagenome]|jgi:hypothetical protein
MKKILLIIVLVLCIFQMVVLATAIDIGTEAIVRNSNVDANRTYIAIGNPANESGKITSVEIYTWTGQSLVNCEVATFYGSGVVYSTRDTEFIGAVAAGAKRTFTVDLDVEAGDLIGIFFTDGAVYKTEGGSGMAGIYYYTADYIPCTNETFVLIGAGSQEMSLYGTGEAEAPPPPVEVNVINMGINF